MTNIPTDLLRTFVAVVDLRSFTKAAVSLGITQPAVSAQIKRLQFLLGDDIFDRSTQGVSLTPHGEIVVSYARRLLSLNDQIMHLGGVDSRQELVIRVGAPNDYVGSMLPDVLVKFRQRFPEARLSVRSDHYEALARQLRVGDIDLVVGVSIAPPHDARHCTTREVVWLRGKSSYINKDAPIPLVSYGPLCMYHRLVVRALNSSGLDWEDVFTGPSIHGLKAAVSAGLGVMALTRRRAIEGGDLIWDDAPLPKLPDVYSSVLVREGGAREIYEQLADEIAAVMYSSIPTATPRTITSIDKARKANSAA